MNDKVTANDIRKALRERYVEPDWLLGFEVGNGTGSNVSRHADAIAICQYPSRGYEVRGFEIKVSRQDLQRELDTPAKADAFAPYCNYWFLVAPKGLTEGMQIPEPWGIIEYADGKLRQKKQAAFSKNTIDYGFALAFIRGIRRADEQQLAEIRAKVQQLTIENVNMNIRSQLYDYERLLEKLRNFEKRTGINLTSKYHSVDEKDIQAIALAKRLLATHEDRYMAQHIRYVEKDLEDVTGWIKKTLEEIKKFSVLMNGK